jgi:hypothetical protein
MQNEDVGCHCADHSAREQYRSNGTSPGEEVQKPSGDFNPTSEIAKPLSQTDSLEDFDPLVVQGWKLLLTGHEKENGDAAAQHPPAEIRLTRDKAPVAELAKDSKHTYKISCLRCTIMSCGLIPD